MQDSALSCDLSETRPIIDRQGDVIPGIGCHEDTVTSRIVGQRQDRRAADRQVVMEVYPVIRGVRGNRDRASPGHRQIGRPDTRTYRSTCGHHQNHSGFVHLVHCAFFPVFRPICVFIPSSRSCSDEGTAGTASKRARSSSEGQFPARGPGTTEPVARRASR